MHVIRFAFCNKRRDGHGQWNGSMHRPRGNHCFFCLALSLTPKRRILGFPPEWADTFSDGLVFQACAQVGQRSTRIPIVWFQLYPTISTNEPHGGLASQLSKAT